MIATLRRDFVNVWLLAKDLEAIAARAADADVATACKRIKENYKYPVDSVLLTPDLRVVGHVNVQDPSAIDPVAYRAWLRRGLAATRGEAFAEEPKPAPASRAAGAAAHRGLVLTPDAPTGTVLDVVRRAAVGEPGMKFFMIDATEFPGGGVLEIEVRVGTDKAAGRFELCTAVSGGMAPVRTTDKVAPGETAKLMHEFEVGARFGLAAMAGAGSAVGDTNAFLATITVRKR